MVMIPVESSNLDSIGYSEKDSALFVRFRDGARVYRYSKVPLAIWQAFLLSPSKGKFFSSQIRDFFSYEQVDEADAA